MSLPAVTERMALVNVDTTGNNVTITAKSGSNFGTDDGYNNCFCVVLDVGIDLSKIKVLSGNYNIEEIDKKKENVASWTESGRSDTSFIVWLTYEGIKDGKTIVFGTTDNSATPVAVNFSAVKGN